MPTPPLSLSPHPTSVTSFSRQLSLSKKKQPLIANLLCTADGSDKEKFIYPYKSSEVSLVIPSSYVLRTCFAPLCLSYPTNFLALKLTFILPAARQVLACDMTQVNDLLLSSPDMITRLLSILQR